MEVILNRNSQHKISELELIKRVIEGEKELYEILLRRNNQKLYRVIRTYIKDPMEIEDIMQNSYLKAYQKLHQFKHGSTYSTWLIRIGINESLARLKEKGKIFQISNNSQFNESNTILEMPDNNQANPETKIIHKESKQLLEDTIDSLEVKYKAVYILKEVEEMSIKEISECLGISVSNTKVRLHRAKHMLKEKLYELSGNTPIFEFGFSRCDRVTENVMKLLS
ncbi:MAG: RNA polymerase sigma factor [Flavobacteriales bacterium]|nr:RNA polymerase sigma factor [Flavobacteriales bacterium]